MKAKKRTKKYQPRPIVGNPLNFILGGMERIEPDRLNLLKGKSHAAMHCMVHGNGTRALWDQLVGALNMANVMCDMGTGDEYRFQLLAGRDALLSVGKRFLQHNKFVFTGPEMQAVNLAIEIHEAQLDISRIIDVERAADEVIRRVRSGINTCRVVGDTAERGAD